MGSWGELAFSDLTSFGYAEAVDTLWRELSHNDANRAFLRIRFSRRTGWTNARPVEISNFDLQAHLGGRPAPLHDVVTLKGARGRTQLPPSTLPVMLQVYFRESFTDMVGMNVKYYWFPS